MSNKTLVGGAILVVGGLLIFGRWYSGGVAQTANPYGGTHNQANISKGISNQLAPDFSLPKLDGGTISLAEFRGKKPVVLDFWATWCPNCRRNIPHLENLYEKYKDQVEVIGINLQEDAATVKNFVSQYGTTYPVALDPQGLAAQAYGVRYTNYHVLIDKNGNLVRQIPGDIQESDIASLIQ